jgi:asparagine synthase (glutamine-hydrolysing)
MCGIVGVINYHKYNLEKAKESLVHRGPDEQEIFRRENIALVHTRLSIQDISSGHQPFHYGDYSIIFNGEIYNHLELRNSLEEFEFKTTSDTETLLYLYIKYKEECLEMLDGMFAFAVVDFGANNLFISRDRAGKKPLYLYRDEDSLFFASELNAIKAGVGSLEIDEESIYSYLRDGFFYGAYTPYKNVQEIDAGSFYNIKIDTLEIKKSRYFDIKQLYNTSSMLSFEEAMIETDKALHISVKDRLLSSDLEVGAFLSGGIDSSLIVAVASEYQKNLKNIYR